MSAFSDYLENAILGHIFKTSTLAKPSVSIALCTGATSDTQTGSTIPEIPSGRGYTRVSVTDSDWGTPTAGTLTNTSAVTFGPCTATNWGTISHLAIVDATSAGNVLFHAPLASSKVVEVGDQLVMPISAISVRMD